MAPDGQREYFEGVETAMEALPVPLEDRAVVRELIRAVPHDQVWINPARGYIAVSHGGEPVGAYINRGFVDVRDGADYRRTELSGYARGGRAAQARAPERAVVTCPVHHVALPASGVCDECS